MEKMTGERKPSRIGEKTQGRVISEETLNRVEFHRHALALLPAFGDKRPGVALFVEGGPGGQVQRFCSCSTSKSRTCPHILELAKIYTALKKALKGKTPDEDFRSSIWYRLAGVMAEGSESGLQSVRLSAFSEKQETGIKIYDSNGQGIMTYLSGASHASRFLERCARPSGEETVPRRSDVLEKLAAVTITENERLMLERGFKTRRQVLEESLWYRVAYHGYREFGAGGCTFQPAIEEKSGSFQVACSRDGEPVFRMAIPRQTVKTILLAFSKFLPNQHNMPVHPVPLKSIFKISANTELDLEIRPLIRVIQEDGEERFFEREDLERFRYGNLVYIKELGIMAELERSGRERKFKAPVKMVLKKSQVPTFLEDFGDEIREGGHMVGEEVKALRIFKKADRVEISPGAIDRDWCWLDVKYGFGNSSVSLREILGAKNEGQRFIGIADGWLDCLSPDLDRIAGPFRSTPALDRSGRMQFSRLDLFRLKATMEIPLEVKGRGKPKRVLDGILQLRPSHALPALKGMTSRLRPYQELGTEWIIFLFENGFGGLLCDEMGLGKTHQIMAFMLFLKGHTKVKEPFLVICPTTVLSHWKNKIREHAPGLKAAVYYGGQRNLQEALKEHDLLITSYGILLRDVEQLERCAFSLAVFDEIQFIKNAQTLTCKAALRTIRDMNPANGHSSRNSWKKASTAGKKWWCTASSSK
jgi:hypothetical protein